MARRRYQILERIFIALIAIGIVGMFQSIQIDLYFWGFHLVLVGTLGFMICYDSWFPKTVELLALTPAPDIPETDPVTVPIRPRSGHNMIKVLINRNDWLSLRLVSEISASRTLRAYHDRVSRRLCHCCPNALSILGCSIRRYQ